LNQRSSAALSELTCSIWYITARSVGVRWMTPAWFCSSRVTAIASLLVEAM
jgi:hypothetical protein